jgi:hypothetical protein
MVYRAGKHRLPGGRTHRFEQLEPALQRQILEAVADGMRGRPVLAFVDSSERWTLLTTREVVCREHGHLRGMSIRNLATLGSDSRPPEGSSLEEVGRWKGSWEYLRLVHRDGTSQTVWVPCGGEAYALWNILLPFARARE